MGIFDITDYIWFTTSDGKQVDFIKADVLDRIKTEILDEVDYAYAESDELPDDDYRYGLERAVEIINKYKRKNEE